MFVMVRRKFGLRIGAPARRCGEVRVDNDTMKGRRMITMFRWINKKQFEMEYYIHALNLAKLKFVSGDAVPTTKYRFSYRKLPIM